MEKYEEFYNALGRIIHIAPVKDRSDLSAALMKLEEADKTAVPIADLMAVIEDELIAALPDYSRSN